MAVKAPLGPGAHPVSDGVMVDASKLAGVSIRLGQIEGFKNEHDLLGMLHVLLLDGWVLEHAQLIWEERPGGGPRGSAVRCWGDLVTASGEFSWPPAGRLVTAYGEDLMAADSRPCTDPPHDVGAARPP